MRWEDGHVFSCQPEEDVGEWIEKAVLKRINEESIRLVLKTVSALE